MKLVLKKAHQLLFLIKLKFIRTLQYRAEILGWIVIDFLPFLILFLVWDSIYAGQEIINDLTLSATIFYYLLAYVIDGMTTTHFEGWRSEEIRNGKIDQFMIKPYSYIKDIVITDTAGKLFYFVLFLPLLAVFFFATFSIFDLTLPVFSVYSVIFFLVLLVTTYAIQLALGVFITLLTFWFEGANGLEHFKWLAFTLFSGLLLPPNFMPSWLKTITDFSPLKYTYLIPIQVLQGSYTLVAMDWLIIGTTIFGLWSIVFFTWQRAVKIYTSAGG